jgi:hypothetical protein
MNCFRQIVLVSLLVGLSACASHSSKAIAKLDDKSEDFGTGACQNARQNAWIHDELKTHKLWAAPSLLLMMGPAAAVPLFAANVGLNTADHMKAREITTQCGGTPPSQEAMAGNIAMDAALDLTVGAVVPVGSTVAKFANR